MVDFWRRFAITIWKEQQFWMIKDLEFFKKIRQEGESNFFKIGKFFGVIAEKQVVIYDENCNEVYSKSGIFYTSYFNDKFAIIINLAERNTSYFYALNKNGLLKIHGKRQTVCTQWSFICGAEDKNFAFLRKTEKNHEAVFMDSDFNVKRAVPIDFSFRGAEISFEENFLIFNREKSSNIISMKTGLIFSKNKRVETKRTDCGLLCFCFKSQRQHWSRTFYDLEISFDLKNFINFGRASCDSYNSFVLKKNGELFSLVGQKIRKIFDLRSICNKPKIAFSHTRTYLHERIAIEFKNNKTKQVEIIILDMLGNVLYHGESGGGFYFNYGRDSLEGFKIFRSNCVELHFGKSVYLAEPGSESDLYMGKHHALSVCFFTYNNKSYLIDESNHFFEMDGKYIVVSSGKYIIWLKSETCLLLVRYNPLTGFSVLKQKQIHFGESWIYSETGEQYGVSSVFFLQVKNKECIGFVYKASSNELVERRITINASIILSAELVKTKGSSFPFLKIRYTKDYSKEKVEGFTLNFDRFLENLV